MLKRIAVVLCLVGLVNVAHAGLQKGGGVYTTKTASTAGNDNGVVSTAEGNLIDVDISGLPTGDGYGEPGNVILSVDLGTGVDTDVTGVGWDVTIEAFDPSWLSEAGVLLVDSTEGLTISPGAGDDFPGVGSYSSGGIVDISDAGFADVVAPGGILTLELGESFDDASVSPDGMWLGDSIFTFEYVPEPGSLAMLGLGLFGLLGFARRK